jgi:hypothetical protein
MNVFHFNATKSKYPLAQTNIVRNVEEKGERKHLLQEVLPIIAQEDPYVIRLFGQQKYIDVVKTIASDG